jgi:hypothetical protein
MDYEEKGRDNRSRGFAMVAAVYSVIVWAGMLVVLVGMMSLAGHVDRATQSASRRGIWVDLVLLAHAVVIGLITTAVLYSLYVTDVGTYVWSRLHG